MSGDNKEFIWTDESVIDFVNWYLRLHKLDYRFSLENMDIVKSFKNGDDASLWQIEWWRDLLSQKSD